MDEKLKRSIINKAFIISYYEKHPQTDGQYFKSKTALEEKYGEAKRKYLLTGDEGYVEEMKSVKKLQKLNVGKTQYDKCVNELRALKTKYCDEVYKDFWAMISAYSQNGVI